MGDRDIGAAIKIVENNFDFLKTGKNIQDRYQKVLQLVPGMYNWDPLSARQLIFYIQRAHKIDFGVCDFYTTRKNEQFCKITGEELPCLCAIPQPYCVFRDKAGKPKYPEFLSVQKRGLDGEVRLFRRSDF